ncbi:integrase core domain-containing protein [Streptomyces sp. NPDC051569]|uniref:integrase core domain-containing protein n=1 Tax=Streptomyces sp. NPDC051569 TaxID=3365661 RepID=UPI0037961541
MGRTGQCWDNALAESFFSTLKNELLGRQSWPTRAAAHTAIFEPPEDHPARSPVRPARSTVG